MAFASTVTKVDRGSGRYKKCWGTFTNGASDTGGTISTGFKLVDHFDAAYTSHLGSSTPKVTISAGNVTIVTDEGADGTWIAHGF